MNRTLINTWIVPMLLPVGGLIVWWFASANSSSIFFPPLSTIVESFQETWLFSRFTSDMLPSLGRMLTGYGIAVVVGVAVGIAFGRSRRLSAMFQPAVNFIRSVPAATLVPVATVLLGIGDPPKIALIAFVCVFPILLNTIDGVRAVDPGLEDVARSFRLTWPQRLMAVQLPSAAPAIFSGMRIAISLAFVMMIISEMFAATNGIGYVTILAQQSFATSQMWAGMVLLALLGASFNVIFLLIEAKVLRWHVKSKGA